MRFPFQNKMVQEYDSEPFSDMSPSEEGNVCHDPGGGCDDDLVQGALATLFPHRLPFACKTNGLVQ